MDKVLRRMLPTKLRDAILEAGTTTIDVDRTHTGSSNSNDHIAQALAAEGEMEVNVHGQPALPQRPPGGNTISAGQINSSMVSFARPRIIEGQASIAIPSSSTSGRRETRVVEAQSALRSIEDVCVLVVRFKTPAILSSLVDSVELVRVMRLLGETVEQCCIRRGGRRVSFHAFKMVFAFGLRPQDDDDLLEAFVRRALLAASDSLRSLHELATASSLVLAASAAVHCGEV